MSRYIINRLLLTIPVLLGVSVLVFAMLHLVPGDPIMAMFAQTGASGRQIEEIKEQLSLLRGELTAREMDELESAVRPIEQRLEKLEFMRALLAAQLEAGGGK